MTFSEAYDKLYPRKEEKPEKDAEAEKMVETDSDGDADDAGTEGGEQ